MSRKHFKAGRMRKNGMRVMSSFMAGFMAFGTVIQTAPAKVYAADSENGWREENGTSYWYENGVRQGVRYNADGSIDETYRGKEIYDPDSDAWYWLDNVQQGAAAKDKDVYQESDAGNWADRTDGTGKWVRYDAAGHMVKGWNSNANGTYYFDPIYGTMAKGYAVIDGGLHYFDENTGVEQPTSWDGLNGWVTYDNIYGNSYWYENGVRQGVLYNEDGSIDTSYRGKEIYDPDSDAWYWLDSVDNGKKAINKDVYQDSFAGDWGETTNEQGQHVGKWVRYDAQGHMVKGWSTNENGTYYFDPIYGTMAKGTVTIDGVKYEFDGMTGTLANPAELADCTITLSQTSYEYDGKAKEPTVTVKNKDGEDIPASEYTVSYENNVNVGTAKVTVTANSTSKLVKGSVSKTFSIVEKEKPKTELSTCIITLSQDSYDYDGIAKKPTVTVTSGSTVIPSTEYTVSYKNNVNVGTAKVTVTANSTSKVLTGSITKTFSIVEKEKPKTELSTCTITLSQDSYDYDGTEKKPTVTVKSGSTVIPSTEYIVSYENNVNVGTAKVTVTANSASKVLTGSVTKTFSIVEKEKPKTELSACTITLSQDSYDYDGTAKQPTVTVKSGSTVIPSTEYTVSYENNVNVGTATVTVTANSASKLVTGSVSKTFSIVKKQPVEQKFDVQVDKQEMYIGDTATITATSSGGSISYKSSDNDVATVSDEGIITATGKGIATITVTAAGTSEYLEKSIKIEVTVKGARPKYSGTLGDVVWEISNNGELSVTGSCDGKLYTGENENKVLYPWNSYRDEITSAYINVSGAIDLSYLFCNLTSLSKVDLSDFDTSQVTNMRSMFMNCKNLSSLDLSKLNTSKVTDMYGMFADCSNLSNIDINGFDTSHVTNMSFMFSGCSNLVSVDVSGFDTSRVTDMHAMFQSCSNLANIDVSRFNTNSVTDMSFMFSGCRNLVSVDVSRFDTSCVTDMCAMFQSCNNLNSVDISGFDTSQVTDMHGMFANCSNLSSIDINGFDTSQVTDMKMMFSGCSNLSSVDVSNFDTSKVTDMAQMFSGCSNLSSIDVSNFNTSKVTDMAHMFSSCSSLSSIDLSNFDTSKATNMCAMFQLCSDLNIVDISGFDTSRVTDMSFMFYGCSSLVSVDVSGFDTSQVIDMKNVFSGCSNLSSIDVSNFDTSKVTDMFYMFYGCSSLSSIDVSNFDTSKVTDMSNMFHGCSNLSSIDVSNFDTSKVTNMSNMFHGCSNLSSIDVSSFNTNQVIYMRSMFEECTNLKEILAGSGWDSSKQTWDMFYNCGTDHVTVKQP